MNIRLGTLGLMYTCYGCRGQDHDGYVLRDGGFSIVLKEARVWVSKGTIIGGCIMPSERFVNWADGRGRYGCRRAGRGQIVGCDCQREQWYVVFLRQAYGGRRGGESGAESAMKWCEGYTEVDRVVFNSGLDGVGFEDCVLFALGQFDALCNVSDMRLTIARTLDSSQEISHVSEREGLETYAHT